MLVLGKISRLKKPSKIPENFKPPKTSRNSQTSISIIISMNLPTKWFQINSCANYRKCSQFDILMNFIFGSTYCNLYLLLIGSIGSGQEPWNKAKKQREYEYCAVAEFSLAPVLYVFDAILFLFIIQTLCYKSIYHPNVENPSKKLFKTSLQTCHKNCVCNFLQFSQTLKTIRRI